MAYGFADVGNAVGIMLLPILVEELREIYGFRGTIALLGGIVFHSAPLLLLITSLECDPGKEPASHGLAEALPLINEESSEEGSCSEDEDSANLVFEGGASSSLSAGDSNSKQSGTSPAKDVKQSCNISEGNENHTLLKPFRHVCETAVQFMRNVLGFDTMKRHPSYIIFFLFKVFQGATVTAWVIFLIPHGVSKGFSLPRAVFLASLGGFGNALGRIAQGPIIHMGWMTSIDLLILMTVVNAMIFLLDPVFNFFWILGIAAFIGGLTIGSRLTVCVLIIADFAQPETFATVIGWSALFYGVGEPIGGFLVGMLI